MPAICNYSDRHERATLIEEWLKSVCFRDLMQLRGVRYEGAVARDLLELIAKNPELSQADLARQLGLDSRVIGKYLVGLEALYVFHRIRPYRVRREAGSDPFYLFDAAVAEYLGASKETCSTILLLNEIYAQAEYSGARQLSMYFYALRGQTKFDLRIKSAATLYPLVVSDRAEESYLQRSLTALRRFA